MLFSTVFQLAVSAMMRSPTLASARGMVMIREKEGEAGLGFRLSSGGISNFQYSAANYMEILLYCCSWIQLNIMEVCHRRGTVPTLRAGQCESPVGAIATLRFKAPTVDRMGTTCRHLSYSVWGSKRLKLTNLALILRVDGAFFFTCHSFN